jgi:hypothetical protein
MSLINPEGALVASAFIEDHIVPYFGIDRIRTKPQIRELLRDMSVRFGLRRILDVNDFVTGMVEGRIQIGYDPLPFDATSIDNCFNLNLKHKLLGYKSVSELMHDLRVLADEKV